MTKASSRPAAWRAPVHRLGLAAMVAFFLLHVAGSAAQDAADQPSFDVFLQGIRAEAAAMGLKPETLDVALANLAPEPVVVARDRAQPEVVQSLDAYVSQRLSARTVRTAREMAVTHRNLLRTAESRYGVPPAVVVAIWGLESNFGRFTGTYPTIRALATLAYDNRRPLFRTELFQALLMIDRGVAPGDMKGSWAGAMGQPQFMPSSFLRHAVDLDDDGRIDIWTSTADVFGSMAHYLQNAGWTRGERWGREVSVSKAVLAKIDRDVPMRTGGCRALRAMTVARPLKDWQTLGVRLAGGRPLPTADVSASLVRGEKRFFLVYRNYEAFLDYNCSSSYAVAVGLLSDRIPATR
jgi:membrane-bound lytic murein transglycosylase B